LSQSKGIKNFSYITAGNVIGGAILGIFYLIFAALLDPEDYGLMSYIIALAGTFSLFSRFGLPYTTTVYLGKNDHLRANQAQVLTLITTGIAAIVLLPINQYASLLCIGTSFFVINIYDLIGKKQYKKYFSTYMIKTVSLITIPFLLYFIIGIPGIIIGMAIGNLLGSFNFFFSLNKQINGFRELRKDFKVLIHNFTVDASTNLSRSIDKIIIVPLFGLIPVAFYQFNLQIMLIIVILPLSLYQFLLSEESSGVKHTKINFLVILASIIIVILTMFISPYFINEFFPKFNDGILGLQIIIFSVIPISISSILNAKLQAQKSTNIGFAAILKIGSLLALIVILGYQFGGNGLSMAVLISSCIEAIALSVLYRQFKSAARDIG